MTELKTYRAGDFFEPGFHFSIRREINRANDFNLENRFQREFWKITCILDGQGEVVINDSAYSIMPGSIYLVHPQAVTTYNITGEALELYNILFDLDFLGAELKTLKDDRDFFTIFSALPSEKLNPLIYIQNTGKNLRSLIRDMYKEYHAKDANYRVYLKLKLIELLIIMQRSGVKKLRELNRNELVDYIDHLLESDYQSNITLKYLAEKVGMSPNYLCTVYRQNSNISIVQKLKSIRLQRAEKMLRESTMTISEICYECGFNDLSYFYRSFAEVYGCNPGDHRKKFG